MKENRTGMHEKRSSIPNYRRTSVVTNPFLLSEIDEESYDSSSEPISNADKLPKTSQTAPLLQKQTRGGGVSFKSVAKAITKQRNWSTVLKEVRQSDDHSRARGFVANLEDGEGRLSFNVNAFKSDVQSCGGLSPAVKKTLRAQSWNRTEEEIEVVMQVVKKLKCFARYPMYVKRELAKVVYYDMFEGGRVVIKQGHVGISFYFIVSGSVMVERMEVDKFTGEQHTQVVGEMGEGDAFGELALLHNTRRAATIICKENSEFLRVDKPDFDEVLRNSHQIEWERKLAVLNSQPALQDWARTEIRNTIAHTKIREFSPNTVILGNMDTPADDVYFIQSGKCRVVREITVIKKESSSGKIKLTLPPINFTDNYIKNKPKESVVRKFLTIHILNRGDFFGVGEDLKKTFIISVGRVHCLLISRLIFMKKERGKSLEAMKQHMSETFLTHKQAFKSYIEDRDWKIYKKKLVDEIVKKKRRPNCSTYDDVPIVVRIENNHYFEK
ncbi:cAMP-dependent protein kinase regulatory subunit-like [Stylophora pistillata]|uniref:cAMP-dependent protein kinase regulatory subunit-like n=1 Tax=Stylophora pistillata TaxID=50429 RepID=UPI000C044F42|nr:cAMP-dependent protein kinase regulatory subunit-like [Stylophora pistillata]